MAKRKTPKAPKRAKRETHALKSYLVYGGAVYERCAFIVTAYDEEGAKEAFNNGEWEEMHEGELMNWSFDSIEENV